MDVPPASADIEDDTPRRRSRSPSRLSRQGSWDLASSSGRDVEDDSDNEGDLSTVGKLAKPLRTAGIADVSQGLEDIPRQGKFVCIFDSSLCKIEKGLKKQELGRVIAAIYNRGGEIVPWDSAHYDLVVFPSQEALDSFRSSTPHDEATLITVEGVEQALDEVAKAEGRHSKAGPNSTGTSWWAPRTRVLATHADAFSALLLELSKSWADHGSKGDPPVRTGTLFRLYSTLLKNEYADIERRRAHRHTKPDNIVTSPKTANTSNHHLGLLASTALKHTSQALESSLPPTPPASGADETEELSALGDPPSPTNSATPTIPRIDDDSISFDHTSSELEAPGGLASQPVDDNDVLGTHQDMAFDHEAGSSKRKKSPSPRPASHAPHEADAQSDLSSDILDTFAEHLLVSPLNDMELVGWLRVSTKEQDELESALIGPSNWHMICTPDRASPPPGQLLNAQYITYTQASALLSNDAVASDLAKDILHVVMFHCAHRQALFDRWFRSNAITPKKSRLEPEPAPSHSLCFVSWDRVLSGSIGDVPWEKPRFLMFCAVSEDGRPTVFNFDAQQLVLRYMPPRSFPPSPLTLRQAMKFAASLGERFGIPDIVVLEKFSAASLLNGKSDPPDVRHTPVLEAVVSLEAFCLENMVVSHLAEVDPALLREISERLVEPLAYLEPVEFGWRLVWRLASVMDI